MIEKTCTKCGQTKPLGDFPARKGGVGGRHSNCKLCRKVHYVKSNESRRARFAEDPQYAEKVRTRNKLAQSKWREERRDRVRSLARARHNGIRDAVLEKYGGTCSCCGEPELKFLCVDHVNGGGNKERREQGGTTGLYRRLFFSGDIQDGYRVLCHNCNMAIAFYGQCPHSTRAKE